MTTQSRKDEEPDDEAAEAGGLLGARRSTSKPDPEQVLRVITAGPVASDDYVAVRRWALPIATNRISWAGPACGLQPVEEDASVLVDAAVHSLHLSLQRGYRIIDPVGLMCRTMHRKVIDRVRAGRTVRRRETLLPPEELRETDDRDPLRTRAGAEDVEELVIDRLLGQREAGHYIRQIQELLTDARAAAFMIILASAETGESIKSLAEERGLSYGAVRKAAGQARRQLAESMLGLTKDEFDAHCVSLQFVRENVPVGERATRGASELSQNARHVGPQQYLVLVQTAQTKITDFLRSHA